jgi:hypothetical protein
MSHFGRSVVAYIAALLALSFMAWVTTPHAHAQIAVEQAFGAASPLNQNLLVRDRKVSASATAVTYNYDLANSSQVLALHMACSAGTASVTVLVSSDQLNYLTIDTLAGAATVIKNYNNSTVGAGIALSPLAFRYLQIQVSACAAGTSTLTVGAK